MAIRDEVDSLNFELPRRLVLLQSITTMPDNSQLGVTGDPNVLDPDKVLNPSTGEFLLNNSPPATLYLDTVGDELWRKTTSDNWEKLSSSGGSQPILAGTLEDDSSWMMLRDHDDVFDAYNIPNKANDNKLHFLRYEFGQYISKLQVGDSIYTDHIHLNVDEGRYTVPSDGSIDHNTTAMRRLNTGVHGVGLGSYEGVTAVVTEKKGEALHLYQGKSLVALGIGDHNGVDVEDFNYTLLSKFSGKLGKPFKVPTLLKKLSIWTKESDARMVITLTYQDNNQRLFKSASDYDYEHEKSEPVGFGGELVIDLLDGVPVDTGRQILIHIAFTKPTEVAGEEIVGIDSSKVFNIYYSCNANEIIAETLATTGDIDNKIGEHEWSESESGNDHDLLHNADLQWLTDDSGNKIQWTDYHNNLGTTDLVLARHAKLATLHDGDNQLLTDDNGNPLVWDALEDDFEIVDTGNDSDEKLYWDSDRGFGSMRDRDLRLEFRTWMLNRPCKLTWELFDNNSQLVFKGDSSSYSMSHSLSDVSMNFSIEKQVRMGFTYTLLIKFTDKEFNQVSALRDFTITAHPHASQYLEYNEVFKTGQVITHTPKWVKNNNFRWEPDGDLLIYLKERSSEIGNFRVICDPVPIPTDGSPTEVNPYYYVKIYNENGVLLSTTSNISPNFSRSLLYVFTHNGTKIRYREEDKDDWEIT